MLLFLWFTTNQFTQLAIRVCALIWFSSIVFLVLDFDMSAAQQEHTMAIEHLAPRLAALRFELCPCHINDSYFWKVYFVLLHSRLNKHDAEVLSTPQVSCFSYNRYHRAPNYRFYLRFGSFGPISITVPSPLFYFSWLWLFIFEI